MVKIFKKNKIKNYKLNNKYSNLEIKYNINYIYIYYNNKYGKFTITLQQFSLSKVKIKNRLFFTTNFLLNFKFLWIKRYSKMSISLQRMG